MPGNSMHPTCKTHQDSHSPCKAYCKLRGCTAQALVWASSRTPLPRLSLSLQTNHLFTKHILLDAKVTWWIYINFKVPPPLVWSKVKRTQFKITRVQVKIMFLSAIYLYNSGIEAFPALPFVWWQVNDVKIRDVRDR